MYSYYFSQIAIYSIQTFDFLVLVNFEAERGGQAAQPVPLAWLTLSMDVYVQKLDVRPSR